MTPCEQDIADLSRAFDQAKHARDEGRIKDALRLVEGFTERLAAVSARYPLGPQPKCPVLSIVVLSHRDHPGIQRALEALAGDCAGETYEVIFVDDGNRVLFDSVAQHFSSFLGVATPFNVGCAAGRNLGALLGSGTAVVFLDDDGVIEPGCIAALRRCIEKTGAVGVRGKVVPHDGGIGQSHYDLGTVRKPSFINCEGVSIWRREVFLQSGGFNPVLAGHEGIDLCARLWRLHGPLAFVYEPEAILRHNYVDHEADVELKRASFARNRTFVEFSSIEPFLVASSLAKLSQRKAIRRLATKIWDRAVAVPDNSSEAVTLLVIGGQDQANLGAFNDALKQHRNQNFQLIFIDCSDDGSGSAQMRIEWQRNDQLNCLDGASLTAGAALNLAISHARNDVCLLSYVEDLNTVGRVDLTLAHFAADPDVACVSFLSFNEAAVLGKSDDLLEGWPSDVNLIALFGSEPDWSTFAFRKSRFSEPLDADGPVDPLPTWFRKNVVSARIRGFACPIPLVYSTRPKPDAAARLEVMEWAYSRLLGQISKDDRLAMSVLSGSTIGQTNERLLRIFSRRVLRRNSSAMLYDQAALTQCLSTRMKRLGGSPNETQKKWTGRRSFLQRLKQHFRRVFRAERS
ncbi:glycosyltransferase [Mesorhizobium sp. VNQ89]|uniref:glycosyltransferase family 2 protein n=1 Tax=Mesorhizobium quangtriensis TaxID=3157709 RepID=UPI0032B7F1CD